ncbi:MAG: glycerol-3-phosphate acyltransferase [Candidatus Aminicenantaceae bacterium]
MNFLVIPIGYVIGSISPAYVLGKLLRGIDIRQHGDGNAGGMNVYYVLGLKPAVVTAIFDLSKGLILMYIASLLEADPIFIYLGGLAAILGHVFPFYLKFKGGKGIGTSMGILFYYLYIMMKNQWLPFYWLIIYIIGIIILFYIIRKKEIVGAIALPLLLALIFLCSPLNLITIFAGLIVIYIFFINFLINIYKKKPLEQEQGIS